MIVGEAPGHREDDSGKPFVGRSGRLLEETLAEYGFDRRQVFITNAVSCRPPDNRTPTKGEIKACRSWLDYQMQAISPKFVLLLGNVPLQSITGKAGITSRRGRPFEQDGRIYLPTFHPSFILREESNRAIFERDIQLFAEIVERGSIPREENVRPHLVMTPEGFDQLLGSLQGTVSFDVETNALYPWQSHDPKTGEPSPARLKMIGFGTSVGEFSIPMPDMAGSPWSHDEIDGMLRQITLKLEDCFVVGHNGKFDLLWMLVHYGLTWHLDFDTMLAHYILDENSRHGLKELAQKFCGAPDWEIDKDEKRGHTTLEKLAMYHAHDLYYTRRLRFIFGKMLNTDLDIKRVFEKIIMPCARLFIEAEFDGIHVEIEKFADVEQYLRDTLARAEKELRRFGNINWGSSQQLARLLFEEIGLKPLEYTKGGNPSCNESVVRRLDHPCVDALLRYRAAKQQLSFFIEGWKPYLHRKRINGEWHHFLHPSFKIHGTVTGRLSCEHPNLQQVPRDPRIRSLITAPPGWTLVECDLSQIELRIAAELANERNMLDAFARGIDVHWLTALREIERGGGMKELVLDTARTWKQDKSIGYARAIESLLEMGPDQATEINVDWKEIRKKAKAVNFGYLFGMWWKKFKIYARDNYDLTITDEQAQESRESFFTMYNFEPWHRRQRRYVKRHGYVRSLSGRKRRLPAAQLLEDAPESREAERQAINSPVQSFANELNLMAAIQLRKEFGRDIIRIVATVHDAILLWVLSSHVERVTARLLEIMRHPNLLDEFDIRLSVPIEAEAKIGPWGAGVSFEKWRVRCSGSRNLS